MNLPLSARIGAAIEKDEAFQKSIAEQKDALLNPNRDDLSNLAIGTIKSIEMLLHLLRLCLSGRIEMTAREIFKLVELITIASKEIMSRKFPKLTTSQVVNINAADIATRLTSLMSPQQVQEKITQLRNELLGPGAAGIEHKRPPRLNSYVNPKEE